MMWYDQRTYVMSYSQVIQIFAPLQASSNHAARKVDIQPGTVTEKTEVGAYVQLRGGGGNSVIPESFLPS